MYVGGEIAELAAIGRPEIGVVTAVQPVHLSRIGTIEAIEQAKGELVEALPADGVAILNADDERVRRMTSRTAGPSRHLRLRTGRDGPRGGGRVGRRRRDALRPRRRRRATPRRDPDARPAQRPQRACGGGRRPGVRPGSSDRSRPASPWAGPRRTGALVRRGGVTIVDDSYNASPARCSPRSTCWPGCRAGGSRCSARCSSWAKGTRRATSGSAPRRPPSSIDWSWSAGGPPGSGAAREGRAGRRRDRRGARSRGCAGRPGGDPRARRRRPRQGVPRSRARPARRRSRDGAGARHRVTVELIQGVLLAFAIVVILMPPYIRMLRATGFTKRIRVEGRRPTSSRTARRRWAAR